MKRNHSSSGKEGRLRFGPRSLASRSKAKPERVLRETFEAGYGDFVDHAEYACRRNRLSPDLAGTLVHDAYFLLNDRKEKLVFSRPLRGLVKTLIDRAARDLARKQYRQAQILGSATRERIQASDLEDDLISRLDADRVHEVLAPLSDFERYVLISFHVKGLTVPEIARRVDRTPKAVERKLQRLRARLAEDFLAHARGSACERYAHEIVAAFLEGAKPSDATRLHYRRCHLCRSRYAEWRDAAYKVAGTLPPIALSPWGSSWLGEPVRALSERVAGLYDRAHAFYLKALSTMDSAQRLAYPQSDAAANLAGSATTKLFVGVACAACVLAPGGVALKRIVDKPSATRTANVAAKKPELKNKAARLPVYRNLAPTPKVAVRPAGRKIKAKSTNPEPSATKPGRPPQAKRAITSRAPKHTKLKRQASTSAATNCEFTAESC